MARVQWVRIQGDGVAHMGPCLLHNLLFEAGDSGRWIDVYDGRDSGSGTLFQRHRMAFEVTHCDSYAVGIPFDMGIYVDAETSEEATTVVFTPLPP